MSLAQRRTAPESVDLTARTEDIGDDPVVSTEEDVGSSPRARRQTVWRTLSYDAFGGQELTHYESFPPEITTASHLAAYDVSTLRRAAQVAFAILACVLASGIVCGFAALKPVLVAEGVYRDLCPSGWSNANDDERQLPCPEQDIRLNLFFILASITLNVSTVFAGYILDQHGRRICYLVAALILFIGGGIMGSAFAFRGRLPFDGYITGNLLLGLGGTFLFVPSFQLANAFPRYSGLVVALVTGAFDASAAVFLFYRIAYEITNHEFKPQYFFFGFGVIVPLIVLVAEFTLMPAHAYNTRRELEHQIRKAQDLIRDVHDSDTEISSPTILNKVRSFRARARQDELDKIETVTGDAAERRQQRDTVSQRQTTSGVWGVLHGLPVDQQMKTAWFLLLMALTTLQMMRMNYFIATIRAQYRYMLQSEKLAERINEFFDVALPVAGVVSTPFIGLLLNEASVVIILAVLTVLIVVLGVLNCLPFIWAGYATVVAFVFFRPLYYSAMSDYATKVFGFETFGRIYGTITCISGVAQFVQPCLDALTHGPLHDDPAPVNVFFAASGSVVSAVLAVFVYCKGRAYRSSLDEELEYDDRGPDERTRLLS